ncbi:MAG: hypothetical protein ACI81O_000170 [Cyclobacteriaceae bacterium]|jgi:hypothetical protein
MQSWKPSSPLLTPAETMHAHVDDFTRSMQAYTAIMVNQHALIKNKIAWLRLRA